MANWHQRSYSNLTSINLANHAIEPRQVGPIADILIMHSELHSLDLSNCNLEDEVSKDIS